MKRSLLAVPFLMAVLAAQVVTNNYSNTRLGSKPTEVSLTQSFSNFGKLGSFATDGAVYAQPLYVPGVTISSTKYNVLYVATMAGTIYAFNADAPGSSALWSLSTGFGWTSGFPNGDVFAGVGVSCMATPAIDSTAGFLYTVCVDGTMAGNSPTWKLWKVNLVTGSGSNVTLAPTFPGTGGGGSDPVSGGNVLFHQSYSFCRPGLTLANSLIYVACGSQNDASPWHGWVVSYNSSLVQQNVWNSTPNGSGGGLWMSGGAPAVDGSGNLYVVTGNGDYDGITAFSQSAVKLSPTLAVLDWFTASDWSASNALDRDIGSGRPILIPGTTLLAWTSKDSKLYVIDTTCMGHLGGTVGGCTPQIINTFTFPAGTWTSGNYGDMFMNGALYITTGLRNHFNETTVPMPIYRFAVSGSTVNTTPVIGPGTYESPNAITSGSWDGTANAVVWTVTVSVDAVLTQQNATLRALNPADLSEFWNSNTNSRDVLGKLSKFIIPTVVGGRVYVGTLNNGVVVYGNLPGAARSSGTVVK
jgi:hypothetical protein